MDDLKERQNQILNRYSVQIRRAAEFAVSATPGLDYEDACQEASILMLSYAGLLSSGRHLGWLAECVSKARNPEGMIVDQLKEDLGQMYARSAEPQHSEFDEETTIDPRPGDRKDTHVARIDLKRELPRLRREYPLLIATTMQGRTQEELADSRGVSHQAISKALAAERARARRDPFFWRLGKGGNPVPPGAATTKSNVGLTS